MVKTKGKDRKTSKIPLILSLAVLLALVASYFIFPSFEKSIDEAFEVLTSEDKARIEDWVSQFGFWGPLVIIAAFVLQMFLFIIPNILLIIICVLSYGPVWGGLLAWFGIVLASTVGYFIGNKLSPVTVHKLVSEKAQRKLHEFIKSYGMKAIIALRLSSFSNDGLSLVAGLLSMPYRKFIAATIIGITPLVTAFAIFGGNGNIQKILPWVGAFMVACLVVYIIVDKRRARKKTVAHRRGLSS